MLACLFEIACCALDYVTYRCPMCGNDLLSLSVLNEEQQKLTAMIPMDDVLKCEVCDVFFEKDALKSAIFAP